MLYATILESSFLKLPLEVITAVFNHVSQTSVFRHVKIIVNTQAQSNVDQVA